MGVSISYRPPLTQTELDDIVQEVISQTGPSASGTNYTSPSFNLMAGGSFVVTTTFNNIQDAEIFHGNELITGAVEVDITNISGASTVTVSSNQSLSNCYARINGN